MAITYYVGGNPSVNPMSGAPQANAANQAQYQAVLNGYNAALKAQQLAMNNMYGQYQKGLGTVQGNIGTVDAKYDNALGLAMSGIDRVDQGYQGAANTLSQVGASYQQQLQDQYERAAAAATQSAIDRGMYNSTVQDTGQRGAQFDFAKNQISLMDQLNTERANLANQEYQTMAAGYGQYDQIAQAQAGAMAQGYQGYNSLLAASLANQQRGYEGYQGILQNQLGFMGSVNTVPIQNQVIPIGGLTGGGGGSSAGGLMGAPAGGAQDIAMRKAFVNAGGGGALTQMQNMYNAGMAPGGFAGVGVLPGVTQAAASGALGGYGGSSPSYAQAYGYQ